MKLIAALDQGTTGTTVLLFDEGLRVVGRGYREFPQYFPQPGWVEHDPEEIWRSCTDALVQAMHQARAQSKDLVALGITNQRETVVVWDRRTGAPAAPAIVWQCRRTVAQCSRLRAEGREPWIAERTGLRLDPYFSGTKLAWLLENVPGLAARAARGEAAAGTIDSWLLWKLSGGAVHATDPSNASRTLLFNLRTRDWDPELLALFGVPRAMLPEVRPTAGPLAVTRGGEGVPDGVPVLAVIGDQQAALFGQAAVHAGDAKCTYGTGAFLLLNTGEQPAVAGGRLLRTVAWTRSAARPPALGRDASSAASQAAGTLDSGLTLGGLPGAGSGAPGPAPAQGGPPAAGRRGGGDGETAGRASGNSGGEAARSETQYALEGSVFACGAAVQWLRDGLGVIASASETAAMAASVPDTAGVVFVPAFVGLGAPYWDPDARGAILGLTRGATRAHLARAALEAMAHQVADLVDAMATESGRRLASLRVDGGASANDWLMQFQADLLGLPVVRPQMVETTALGAAALAAEECGLWGADVPARLEALPRAAFEPGMAAGERADHRERWQEAVRRVISGPAGAAA